MYLSELKLWNFRKYTSEDGSINEHDPHLIVPFTKGLNVLIGENDSGKSAIIDAVKMITKTHSMEWIHLFDSDFSQDRLQLRIEVVFEDLSEEEAANFIEKVIIDGRGNISLCLILEATRTEDRILPYEVKAFNGSFHSLSAIEKDLIKTTYLRALRDADFDLTAKRNSRVSQILLGHDLFKEGASGKNKFEQIIAAANKQIEDWFIDDAGGESSNRSQIKDVIDTFIKSFLADIYESELSISDDNIKSILEKISIRIKDGENLGLGTMNRLFMAAELLHLRKKSEGVKVCLIEELEAHLHPQAQMKVIEGIQKEENVQFILSTHSPNLASKIKINNDNVSIILCKDRDVYPLTKGKTKLENSDYLYLQNFLDVTKANLFFAKGIIIVEGWAEELIIPALANNLEKDLTQKEVSIVNVGSTAYLHYARILMRNDGKNLKYPVSIITDFDVRPREDWSFDKDNEAERLKNITDKLEKGNNHNIQLFIAKHWTLEWCLFSSTVLSKIFMDSCHKIHSKTAEFEKNEQGNYDIEKFRDKLAEKLINRSLDKVAIATEICMAIKTLDSPLDISEEDTAYYLVEAINHVCR